MNKYLDLLYEVGCLRFLTRSWVQFLNPDFQNLAEHTTRVMWIAMVLSKHEGLKDTGKVVKMALVHDLSESRSGDLHYVSREYSTRNEHLAIQDVLQNTSLNEEMIALWEEYEALNTIEAKVVKDADYLDVDLELQEQEARGHTLKQFWKEMRHDVYKKLNTKSAKKLWKLIQGSNPHSWHYNARNRYNSGDWNKSKINK